MLTSASARRSSARGTTRAARTRRALRLPGSRSSGGSSSVQLQRVRLSICLDCKAKAL